MWLIDLMLPRRCVACGGASADLCASCRRALIAVVPPLCGRCGAPSAWPVERCRECAGRRLAFVSARAAVAYAGPAAALLRAWKERGLRQLAPVAAGLVTDRLERPEVDVITYIPPDPARQLRRGLHPAEALARELAARWELTSVSLLARTRQAQRQAALDRSHRGGNVRGIFAATSEAPPRILLIDDVYTTGSTANAAASALRKQGAREVLVVTFARATR